MACSAGLFCLSVTNTGGIKMDYGVIEKRIGYCFQNRDLLQQAFVRRSYAQENGGEDNEVLEFIGDKALDVVVVKLLTDQFGFFSSECDNYDRNEDWNEFCCELDEGELTDYKKRLVSRQYLSDRIDAMGLAKYLIMGKGDIQNHAEERPAVKEDLFEAIVGAVALDSGWNWQKLTEIVELMLDADLEAMDRGKEEPDYVREITEWNQKNYEKDPFISFQKVQHAWPVYINGVFQEERNGKFSCRVSLGNARIDENRCYWTGLGEYELKEFTAEGNSKREARFRACKSAYEYLNENNLLFSISDEIENPNWEDAISQLEILARRGYFSIPTYDFRSTNADNGNSAWECTCRIAEKGLSFTATASSKKNAKKTAAYAMLKKVLKKEESNSR